MDYFGNTGLIATSDLKPRLLLIRKHPTIVCVSVILSKTIRKYNTLYTQTGPLFIYKCVVVADKPRVKPRDSSSRLPISKYNILWILVFIIFWFINIICIYK